MLLFFDCVSGHGVDIELHLSLAHALQIGLDEVLLVFVLLFVFFNQLTPFDIYWLVLKPMRCDFGRHASEFLHFKRNFGF